MPLATEPNSSERTILVVDDDPDVRDYAVAVLEDRGYRVLSAEDGIDALSVLARERSVDLLFTDVVMPEINGRRLAEEALRRRPNLKVLFTTGYTKNAVVHNGVLDPGVDMIGKPFTIDDLASKLREVLERKDP